MNFLKKRNSTVASIVCLFILIQLSSCYASPVRSPRTSAVKLRNILANMQRVTRSDQPSPRQDYQLPYNEENGVAANQPTYLPKTDGVPVEKPETIDEDTGSFNNQDPSVLHDVSEETEQPVLPSDGDNIQSESLPSDPIETVTPSDVVQGAIESQSTQKLEETSHSKTGAEQEPLSDNLVAQAPIETSEPYHSPTVAGPSDPAELPLMYPIVRVPEAPSATPIITVADLPLEPNHYFPSTAALPEKAEISSSLEAQNHPLRISGPEQGDNVVAIPLDLDTKEKTQTPSSSISFDSQIQVDQPKYHPNISYDIIINDENPVEKDNSSSRPFGSTPQLRELGFPPISNTQDNFGVQVNWAEFR